MGQHLPYPWDHMCFIRGTTSALSVEQHVPYPWDNICLTRGTTSALPVGPHVPYPWDNICLTRGTTCALPVDHMCLTRGTTSALPVGQHSLGLADTNMFHFLLQNRWHCISCWLTNARFVKARVTVLSCLIKQRLVFLNISFFYLKSLHSSDVRLIFFLTPIVNL